MDAVQAVEIIKQRLHEAGGEAEVPLLKGGSFQALMVSEGIRVDSLGAQSLLPWAVFQ